MSATDSVGPRQSVSTGTTGSTTKLAQAGSGEQSQGGNSSQGLNLEFNKSDFKEFEPPKFDMSPTPPLVPNGDGSANGAPSLAPTKPFGDKLKEQLDGLQTLGGKGDCAPKAKVELKKPLDPLEGGTASVQVPLGCPPAPLEPPKKD